MGCGRPGPCGARLPAGADVRPGLDALLVRWFHDPGGRVSWWGGKPKKTTGPPKNPKQPKNPPPPKGKPKGNKPLGNGR